MMFPTKWLVLVVFPLLNAGQAVGQALPTVTLSAWPTSIPNSQSSAIAWTSTNATSCNGTGKGFAPSGVSGSLVVSPKVTATYRRHLHRRRRISKSVSHGGGDWGADACDRHDGSGYGHRPPHPSSNAGRARHRRRGGRQPGHSRWRSREQRVHMVAGGLRRRPYRVDFSG